MDRERRMSLQALKQQAWLTSVGVADDVLDRPTKRPRFDEPDDSLSEGSLFGSEAPSSEVVQTGTPLRAAPACILVSESVDHVQDQALTAPMPLS